MSETGSKKNNTATNGGEGEKAMSEPKKENFFKKTGRKIKEWGKDTWDWAKHHPGQAIVGLVGLGTIGYGIYKIGVEPVITQMHTDAPMVEGAEIPKIESAEIPAIDSTKIA